MINDDQSKHNDKHTHTHREREDCGGLPAEKVKNLSMPCFPLTKGGYHVASGPSGRLTGRVEQHGT